MVAGPSIERLVRSAALLALVLVFAGMYLWDGYVGYARRNAAELVRLLGVVEPSSLEIDARVTADLAWRLAESVRPGEPLTAVSGVLGEPHVVHGDDAYYVGPGGWIKVQLASGRIRTVTWVDGGKTASDQKWQRWIGYALCVLALGAAGHFGRVLTTNLRLSDAGLALGRRPPIPFEAMTALRADPTGCVEVEYALHGETHRVHLDPYVYRGLERIAIAIRERKGFGTSA